MILILILILILITFFICLPFTNRTGIMVFDEKYFLKSYAECRVSLLNEKKHDGEISQTSRLAFDMYFDDKNHPNVFFSTRN